MNVDERKEALSGLGAEEGDMEALLEYTANVFAPLDEAEDDGFLGQWGPVMQTAQSDGAAAAVNAHLAGLAHQVAFCAPESVRMELYRSIAGPIPLITSENDADFESMVLNIVYKGRPFPEISKTGASFAFGKTNRFIILSSKPYSNLPAERLGAGVGDAEWRKRSITIRREHECAHYYTRRFFGSSRNNLHDELIADFAGIYAAFGEYRAEWFLKLLSNGRLKVYITGLSGPAGKVVENLAAAAANGVEKWSKTDEFRNLTEAQRIRYLCEKELLGYAEAG